MLGFLAAALAQVPGVPLTGRPDVELPGLDLSGLSACLDGAAAPVWPGLQGLLPATGAEAEWALAAALRGEHTLGSDEVGGWCPAGCDADTHLRLVRFDAEGQSHAFFVWFRGGEATSAPVRCEAVPGGALVASRYAGRALVEPRGASRHVAFWTETESMSASESCRDTRTLWVADLETLAITRRFDLPSSGETDCRWGTSTARWTARFDRAPESRDVAYAFRLSSTSGSACCALCEPEAVCPDTCLVVTATVSLAAPEPLLRFDSCRVQGDLPWALREIRAQPTLAPLGPVLAACRRVRR